LPDWNNKLYFYIVFAALALVVLVTAIQVIFKTALKRKKAVIDDLKVSEAIPTSTPLERPLRSFKKRAKESVTQRFSIFRKVAIMLGMILVLIAATFPFVDQLPQAVISILVGSAAIITGMAAKPFIENFLSGIAITASKMLNIGDTIIMNGNYGTIEDISPTHTVVKLWDWRRFVIPNTQMINQEFVNYTLQDKWLWAHVEFFVSPDADIRQVKAIAEEAARKSRHFHEVEEPSFWVMEAEKDCIKCWLAAWAASPAEAWELKADMRTELILRFQQAGIKSHLNYHQVSSAGVESREKGS